MCVEAYSITQIIHILILIDIIIRLLIFIAGYILILGWRRQNNLCWALSIVTDNKRSLANESPRILLLLLIYITSPQIRYFFL